MKRLLKLFISIIVYIFDCLKKYTLKIIGIKIPGTCVVLYYHSVFKEKREKFTKQLKTLIRFAKPISIDHDYTLEKGKRYVIINFDDGLLSIIENAIKQLLKYNIPSIIFIPTSYLGKQPGWVIDKKYKVNKDIVMNAEQLRKINNEKLINIGSHCVTHKNLLLMNNEDAKKEIYKSKNELEKILNQNIKYLSFPYGAFNQLHLEMARNACYEKVFSIIPKLNVNNISGYVIGRVDVDPSDWSFEFYLKLMGAYRWMVWVINIKKKIRKLY